MSVSIRRNDSDLEVAKDLVSLPEAEVASRLLSRMMAMTAIVIFIIMLAALILWQGKLGCVSSLCLTPRMPSMTDFSVKKCC